MVRTPHGNRSGKLITDTNLLVIFSVTLIAVMGVSTITPAFPKIIQEFSITDEEVGLLITVFALPGVLLAPLMGVLADRYGRKRMLLPSLIVFALAGASCTLAKDFNTLLVLRFIQGFGAAALGMLNITILGDLYRGRTRARAMGYTASVLSIGTASYPSIGGALAVLGWYFPFYLPLLAIPVALLVLVYLRNPEPVSSGDFRRYLARTWRMVIDRRAIALYSATALSFLVLFGSYYTYLPLLLDSLGSGPLGIGLIMSTMSITTALTASQLGRLYERYSHITLLKASYPLYALGLLILPFIPNLYLFLIPTIIFGIGHGINTPSILTLLAEQAPIESRGAFMSFNSLMLRLGQTVGPLVMGALFALGGFTPVFFAGALFLVFALLLLAVLMGSGNVDKGTLDK